MQWYNHICTAKIVRRKRSPWHDDEEDDKGAGAVEVRKERGVLAHTRGSPGMADLEKHRERVYKTLFDTA